MAIRRLALCSSLLTLMGVLGASCLALPPELDDDDSAAQDDDDASGAGDDDDDVDGSNDDDSAEGDDDDSAGPWPPGLVPGPENVCPQPFLGFDRFAEVALERGIAHPVDVLPNAPCTPNGGAGAVAAEDLDGDGDIDLLAGKIDGFPTVFENDGSGYFTPHLVPWETVLTYGRISYGFALADLDGDRLPEVFVYGPGMVLMSANLGGLEFGPWSEIHLAGFPMSCILGISFGDAEGDGDLDLIVPRADPLTDGESEWLVWPNGGSTDLLFKNVAGQFELAEELVSFEGPTLSLFSVFTDIDDDGLPELLTPSDRAYGRVPPTALFKSQPGGYVDIAQELGAHLQLSGMGVAANDLNQDGLLDYCISDITESLACLLSEPTFGGFLEAGPALGLVASPHQDPGFSSNYYAGWSVEMEDFDNDGLLDVAASSGDPTLEIGGSWPDSIWQGALGPMGLEFHNRSFETGFHDGDDNYGLVAADVQGDGALDIFVGGRSTRPKLWINPCSEGAWFQLSLRGPAGNSLGIGARVHLRRSDGRTEMREMQSSRLFGQSPAVLHFGLGPHEVSELEIRWTDGTVQSFDEVPLRRKVEVFHPSLL